MSNYQIDRWSEMGSLVKPKNDWMNSKKKRGANWARAHKHRRENNVSICSCGKRWAYGKPHP